MDINNSNAFIYREINKKVEEEGSNKKVVTFRESYKKSRRKKMLNIIDNPEGEQNKITFQRNMDDWIYLLRRRGAPKHTWAKETLKQIWEKIRADDKQWRNVELDLRRADIREKIKE